jgi:uncharacterized RDD family membrane protein YckC
MAPSNVEAPYAGFWIRAVGYIVDSLIVSIIGAALGFLIGLIAGSVNPNAAADATSPAATTTSLVVGVLVSLSYYAGMWTMNGATFGQRLMGLRVVDAQTLQAIGPVTAIVRWIGLVLSFLFCFAGVIWVAYDSRKQGLMDKLAGTVVVRA